jgi:hypothetical protein
MTRTRLIAAAIAATLIAAAPIAPAFAWRHHGGPLFGPSAVGAAGLGAAAAVATAPFAVIAPPPAPAPYAGYGYPPAPYYYGPPPGYGYSPYGPR